MPLLSRRRSLLIKTEVTPGTDSVPVVGTNAVLVRNLEFTPQDAALVSRELVRGYLGGSEQYVGGVSGKISFEIEMAGSGAAGTAPAYDAILKACGMASTIAAGVSVTYKPISTAFPSVSIYFNVDGVRHRLTNARGNVEISMKTGEIPYFRFTFTGLYNAPTDSALGVPIYTPYISPLVMKPGNTSGFSLYSYAGALDSLNLNFNNAVLYRMLIGAEDVILNGRDVKGSVIIEAPTIAAKDYFTAGLNVALGNLAILHGTTAGNRVQITSATASIANPAYVDQDGIHMLNIPVSLVPSSAGDDEVSIIFT